jgi:hypothetical protein
MRKSLPLALLTGFLLAGVTEWVQPSIAVSKTAFHLAKKEEKPADALVTAVELTEENIANTWFYTLKGRLKNQSNATILTPLIHYEIYSKTTNKIVEAGTAEIEPNILPAGEMGTFEKELNTTGKVRITLVQWQQVDKAVKSHNQMQFFPPGTEQPEGSKGQDNSRPSAQEEILKD